MYHHTLLGGWGSLFTQNKIPVTISLGGGYSESIIDIVEAHCNTFRLAQELYY
jgi:hypothetical protein